MQSHQRVQSIFIHVWTWCKCAILRSRTGRSTKSNRPRFSSVMTDIYRYISREATLRRSLSSFLFFFSSTLSGPAWPHSTQQRETTRTINDFFRRWANLCVIRVISSLVSSSLFLTFRAVPRDRELSCRASYFTWSKTFSSCFPLSFYFTWSRTPLFLHYVLFYVEDSGCMCICAFFYTCASMPLDGFFQSLVFFLFSKKGLHRVSRYTSRTTRPLENSTFLWLPHPTILSLLHPELRRSCAPLSIHRSYPFDVSPPARRSSSFNFVHFCFLNYFFVSSIR